jgi:hypothetical protein
MSSRVLAATVFGLVATVSACRLPEPIPDQRLFITAPDDILGVEVTIDGELAGELDYYRSPFWIMRVVSNISRTVLGPPNVVLLRHDIGNLEVGEHMATVLLHNGQELHYSFVLPSDLDDGGQIWISLSDWKERANNT